MALAPFFSRVRDAVGGTAAITAGELARALDRTVVAIQFTDRVADHESLSNGGVLLVDLLARLYPRIAIDGPPVVRDLTSARATAINPEIEILDTVSHDADVRSVLYGGFDSDVAMCADVDGWQVHVDRPPPERRRPVMAPAADAAACMAAAELFRDVFADALGTRGRTRSQPGSFDLVTGTAEPAPVVDLEDLQLGELHLAGAGAVGQACVATLHDSRTVGRLTVADPETIELSNLQRYVLTTFDDVGARKVDLVARCLDGTGWRTETVAARWGDDSRTGPRRACVLVALDTARDRLGIAAGLHRSVYNAWTQPADVGWSRHEDFGVAPCLACLYYPDRPRPSDDEQIAAALGQPRLRVLAYLVTRTPVGAPLPGIVEAADIPAPAGADNWLAQPLLSDLVSSGMLSSAEATNWASHRIGDLYSEGICGGGILSPTGGTVEAERIVPLAHQSAFAGVMLATEVIVARVDQLRAARSSFAEHRIDLIAGLPQTVGRPRARTPNCFCSDERYRSAFSPISMSATSGS